MRKALLIMRGKETLAMNDGITSLRVGLAGRLVGEFSDSLLERGHIFSRMPRIGSLGLVDTVSLCSVPPATGTTYCEQARSINS